MGTFVIMSHGAKKQTIQTGWGWSSNDKGYFADLTALNTAYPTGSNGWYAVLWSTDTIWIWDSGTSAWVDSWAWWSWSGDMMKSTYDVDNIWLDIFQYARRMALIF